MERRIHTEFEHCPRYDKHELSEAQIIEIAKKAVELARADFYQEVGQTVTNKFLWFVGLLVTAVGVWLTSHGYLK